MRNIESSYQVLGLQPGASEEAVRQAHKTLLDRWYPELLSTKTDLQKLAKQKIREINEAADILLLSMGSEKQETLKTRRDLPAVKPLAQKAEETGAVTEASLPQEVSFRYLPPAFGLFSVLLYGSLVRISSFGETLLGIALGGLGWILGGLVVKGITSLNEPKKHKTIIAWMSIAFLFMIAVSIPALSGRPVSGNKVTGVSSPNNPEDHTTTSPARQGSITLPPAQRIDPEAERESSDFLREGKNLIAAGRYEEAVSALTKSIKINPRDPVTYNSRGMAHAYLKEYGKAIEDYTASVALNPEEDGPYFNRGIVYVALGDYQHAIEDYKAAARLGNEEAGNFFSSQDILW